MTDPTGTRLRVAVPMLTLVPGGMGGTEYMFAELTREWAAFPELDLVALVSRQAAGFSHGRERVVDSVWGGGSTLQRLRSVAQAATLSGGLRQELAKADVIYYPFTVPVPSVRGVPTVIAAHDLQHLDLPDYFSDAERAWRRVTYDRAIPRADAVITLSEFSRRRIVHHLGVDPDRIFVSYCAANTESFHPARGERENFILYPARAWPHKNHARLITAVSRLRDEDPTLRLVLTGGKLDTLGDLPEWVQRRGLVPVEELADLYRRAACVAFPIRYDGFGMPPL